jgi:hypothetical protein
MWDFAYNYNSINSKPTYALQTHCRLQTAVSTTELKCCCYGTTILLYPGASAVPAPAVCLSITKKIEHVVYCTVRALRSAVVVILIAIKKSTC